MSRVDPSTFSWVKDEINESIKQARLSLEEFSTATDDTSQMRMAVAFLHQVSGTLQIVELDGAARLVNEIELVCEGIIDEKIQPEEDNLECLSRGILSLSTYISQLHAGYPDSIVALTPLINELRELRGDEPVSEFDLFNPDLDIFPEASGNRPARLSDEDFLAEVSQARKQLLAAILSWFTQKNESQSLGTILLLFTHLKGISRFDVTSQLWWVATALSEALRDGGIDSKDKEARRYFATLEQELKRTISDGESSLVKSPQTLLLKGMLFQIGKAESNGPVVTELKEAFSLDEQVKSRPETETGQVFEATSPDVLQPIMKALSEEIAVAKNHLNDYFDSENTEANSIEPLLSSLDKTRGAIEVINKTKLLALVEEISHTAQAESSGDIVINKNIALELAEGMLMLEDACSELDDPASDWEEKVGRTIADLHWTRTGEHVDSAETKDVDGIALDEEGTLTDVEFAQLVKVVATEIGNNLEEVVETFEKFSLNMHLNEILKPIPDKLSQIAGALNILERERAIELVLLINDHVSSMIEGKVKPATEFVESTALAISAIESYAASLQHDQPASELSIERAMEELLQTAPSDISDRNTAVERVTHIREEADSWLRNPEDQLYLAILRKDMAAIKSLANFNKDEKLEKIAGEVSSLITMLSEDPEYLTDEIMTTFHQSLTILEQLTGRLPEDAALAAEEPEVPEIADTEPESSLGIVLEEIDQTDSAPGLEIIEQDEVEEPGLDFVEAELELPEIAAELEIVEPELETLEIEPELVLPEVAEAEPEVAESVTREAAVFDDEILEIFLEEAREISVTAKDYFNKWNSVNSDEAALTDLRRSFHTLKGSGRMAGAVEFGELFWLLEELLNQVIASKLEANKVIFALIDEALDKLPALLDDMEKHDESNVNVDYWLAYIEKAHAAEDTESGSAVDDEAEAEAEIEELSVEESDVDDTPVEELTIEDEPATIEVAETADSEITIDDELTLEEEFIPGLPEALQSATVREIYSAEIQKHLDDLVAEIDEIRAVVEPEITDVMHRIIHTLRGSARSVGFDLVADTYESVENLLDGLSARSLYLTKDDIDILSIAHKLGVLLLESVAKPQALEGNLLTGLNELSKVSHTRLAELPNPQMHDGTIEMPSYLSVEDLDIVEESSELDEEVLELEAADETEEVKEDLIDEFIETELEELEQEATLADDEIDLIEVEDEAEIEEIVEVVANDEAETAEIEGIEEEPLEPVEVAVTETAEAAKVEDEFVDELVEIFREEAVDLLSRFHATLDSWRNNPGNEEASTELKRIFHTIKGSARMTGITTIGDLAHNTESMLELAEKAENNIDEALFELIEEVHDTLSMMIENPTGTEHDVHAGEMNQRVLNHFLSAAEKKPVEEQAIADEAPSQDEAISTVDVIAKEEQRDDELDSIAADASESEAAEEKRAVPLARTDKSAAGKQSQVRVDSDLLGTLANYAGEVSIARSRIQSQVSNFKDNLGELHNNIDRFQKQIRELEIQADTQISSRTELAINETDDDFDPLEFDRYTQLQFLSRNLSESLHDLMMIQAGMDNFAGDVEMLLHEQSRLNTDLQEGLTQTRMIAFSTLMPRLRQLARKTSRELDKTINLELLGGEVELDRNVIEQVVPPLEHLLRNSISHGIEDAKTRKKLGKPQTGLLKLEIKREGKDIIIEFSDDGQGLDLEKIRSKAEQKGLLDRGMNPSDDHLANLIFVPGFSTADSVTQVSGRGVGMDVVQSELKKVGGSVSLTTEKNTGTRFSIRLPLSMTVTQAMIITSGGQRFAIPLMAIMSITMVLRSRIVTDASGERSVDVDDKTYPYISLTERLGLLAQLEDETKTPALVMNTATGPIVVGVDELVHATEIVVKSVGVQIAALDGMEGATVLGDGEVSLILDLVDLWNTRNAERAEIDQASLVAQMEEDESPATIMVVDDSLTVRRVTERNLSKYGIKTLLATDGVDALEKLKDEVPDAMLVDIEMPRMDGFELTSLVRDDPVYKDIPIIIITSRSGPKHREKAMELGATLYLTKPYQELELMNAINSVIPLESSRKISAMMEA